MPADGQKPESQPDDPHAKLAHVLELLQQALQAVQEIVGPADGQQQGGEQPQPGQQQPGGQQVTQ